MATWDIGKLNRARRAALDEMRAHGLTRQGWRFAWNNSTTTLGECDYASKTIYLSMHYTEVRDDRGALEIIRHEIAHALAGPRAQHGPRWREIARSIGASGKKCYAPTGFQRFIKYTAVCPSGHGIQADSLTWKGMHVPCKCGQSRKWMTTRKFLWTRGLDSVGQWY